jgi:hypothetical protein
MPPKSTPKTKSIPKAKSTQRKTVDPTPSRKRKTVVEEHDVGEEGEEDEEDEEEDSVGEENEEEVQKIPALMDIPKCLCLNNKAIGSAVVRSQLQNDKRRPCSLCKIKGMHNLTGSLCLPFARLC